MEWTFSKKLKQICNGLSVFYIGAGCFFYSWMVDVRDTYPVQGYLVDRWMSFIPYVIAAIVIFTFICKYCTKKEKACMGYNIIGLFAAVSGCIILAVQFVYYLDIIKTYQ